MRLAEKREENMSSAHVALLYYHMFCDKRKGTDRNKSQLNTISTKSNHINPEHIKEIPAKQNIGKNSV
jgi:hypothetical protein